MISFREKLLAARPDVAERRRLHFEKGQQAMELRRLRDAAGLTQDEVGAAAGIEISEVQRLESLVGPLPTQSEMAGYRAACDVS